MSQVPQSPLGRLIVDRARKKFAPHPPADPPPPEPAMAEAQPSLPAPRKRFVPHPPAEPPPPEPAAAPVVAEAPPNSPASRRRFAPHPPAEPPPPEPAVAPVVIEAPPISHAPITQPPRPSGSTVKYEVVRSFNLAAGINVKHLDVKATQVDVYVEIDQTLDKLIKEGKEGLKIEHLGNVAKAEVEKISANFVATIQLVETQIDTVLQDADQRDAKIKEANEVLKHYAKIVEDRVNAAVQGEWQKYLARRKYLGDFRLKCGVKITLGVIGVGVAVASAALTFGALWIGILAAAKGVLDLAQNIKTLAEGMDTTYEKLLVDIDNVNKLNRQREQAKAKGEGQKVSKTAEALKELANQLAPFTKALTTSANTAGDRAKQFLGQTSKLEDQADALVGQLNKGTASMTKLPERDMTPKLKELAGAMGNKFKQVFADITALHEQAQNAGAFGDRALKAVATLKAEDRWGLDPMEIAGKYGARGVAIYAAANFIFECAKHGKALIPV